MYLPIATDGKMLPDNGLVMTGAAWEALENPSHVNVIKQLAAVCKKIGCCVSAWIKNVAFKEPRLQEINWRQVSM